MNEKDIKNLGFELREPMHPYVGSSDEVQQEESIALHWSKLREEQIKIVIDELIDTHYDQISKLKTLRKLYE